MSTTTQERKASHKAQEAPHKASETHEAAATQDAAGVQDPTQTVITAYLAHAATIKPAGSITYKFNKMGDLAVELPRRYAAGMVMDDDLSLILDKSNVQQFASNMNANAVNRAARLKTAIEKQDQAGINANQPYTAEEVLRAWAEYERTPPGGERQSSMERMRHEAAWKAWVVLLTEHNKSIRDGQGPVIPTDKVGKAYALIRKGDIDKAGQAKETAEAWAKRKQAYVERLLTVPWMVDRIQVQLDLLTAEAEANKAKAAADAAPASTDELF